MDTTQSLATASLLIPTVVLGVVGWRARRDGRTAWGLSLSDGAGDELGRGVLGGLALLVVLLAALLATGAAHPDRWVGGGVPVAGIALYFLVLFTLEEVLFRGVLLTGAGVLVGPATAVGLTSLAIALPYALSPETSVLAVVGAVVTNVMTGVARWRTGRIWFGLGFRWVLNVGVVAVGLPDAGYRLEHPLVEATVTEPAWLSGNGFGPEAGVVGILLEATVVVLVVRHLRGRTGPWRVRTAVHD